MIRGKNSDHDFATKFRNTRDSQDDSKSEDTDGSGYRPQFHTRKRTDCRKYRENNMIGRLLLEKICCVFCWKT